MARIKTGPIVSDVSGKVGDNVFSRNKYGPYVRAFAAPIIPPSAYLTASQLAMSDASDAWLALSDSEVLNYAKFSEQWPRKSFHDGYHKIDPRTLFISCYINQVYAGLSPSPLPVSPGVTGMQSMSVDTTTFDELNIDITGGSSTSDFYILFYATFPQPISVRSVNTPPFYFFKAVTYFTGSTLDLASFYKTRLGGLLPVSTERVFVKAKVIHAESGLEIGDLWEQSLGFDGGTPFILGNNNVESLNASAVLLRANQITSGGNGFITSISVHHGGGAGNVQLGIYDNAGGNINNLLATTPITSNSLTLGWQKINLSSPLAITSGSIYYIAYIIDGILTKQYAATGGISRVYAMSNPPLPNPIPSSSSGNFLYSLFCEGSYT